MKKETKKTKVTRLVQLLHKDGTYYLEERPLPWVKWPFSTYGGDDGKSNPAWAFFIKGEFMGVYLRVHQCCTCLLVNMCPPPDETGLPAIGAISLPVGVDKLEIDTESFGKNKRGYLLVTGSACNGKGTVRVMHNLAQGEWSWFERIK